MPNSIITDEMLSHNNEVLAKQLGTLDGVMTDAAAPSDEKMQQLNDLKNAAIEQNAVTGSTDLQKLTPEQLAQFMPRKPKQAVREFKKVGRNEPCPCGSGKKYKNCCLSSGKYEGLITAEEMNARKSS